MGKEKKKKTHKSNSWWWQPVKLRKVNVKNRRAAVSHCYFCVIIPRCWCTLSSSLAIYHLREPKSMGVGEQWGERKAGKKRLFTQIAALCVCNQRTWGKKSAKILAIFSVHLISRASQVLMSKEGSQAGVLVARALHRWSTDCVSRDGLVYLKLTSEEGSPGRGWGCSGGHSPSIKTQQRGSQVALLWGRLVLPGRGEAQDQEIGRSQWKIPSHTPGASLNPDWGACPISSILLPQISMLVSLITPQSWDSWVANNQSGNGVLFCSESVFLTFYEHAGTRLLNAHVFSRSWYLAVLWDCPQSPL